MKKILAALAVVAFAYAAVAAITTFSQIPQKATPPALTDQVVGVTGGATDNLYTIQQLQTSVAQQGTPATSIGVDCTGATDSTTAIQTWVNANLSGHLIFPLGCTFFTTSTITATNATNLVFRSQDLNGADSGKPAQWQWKGGNGGTACATNYASCVYVLDIESSAYPIISNMAFTTAPGSCPDGFLKFDGDFGASIGTAGLVTGVFLNGAANSCSNPNFIGVSISATAVDNQEDYIVERSEIFCSAQVRLKFTQDAVTNGTTTVTSATANFQNAWVGQRISVSYNGGIFDTTIASVTNSTTVVLAQAVPWSQSNVTLVVGESLGHAIYVGKSLNSIQHYFDHIDYSNCGAAFYFAGGNAQIVQPSGGQSTYGVYMAPPGNQNMSIDFYASENENQALHAFNITQATLNFSNARLTNVVPFAVGFIAAGANALYFHNNQFIVIPPTNVVQMTPGYRTPPTALGNITGGSGYVNGTYTGVTLSNPVYYGTVTADITVSGGAVTSVSLNADPGNFDSFRPGELLTTANSHLGGSGSGFSIAVAATGFGLGNGGNLTSISNLYYGTGPTVTLAQTGLNAWLAAPNSLTSIGDRLTTVALADIDIFGIVPRLGGQVFVGLPTPAAGMYAYITDGLAANCGDSACTTWGTTITGGGGSLKLLAWYNGTNWTLIGK